ncbi:MAG: hypothetical protein CMP23_06420 [Rickettsiales bacterium]|nr:hypothetical protein [Rickettsiales bacterium]
MIADASVHLGVAMRHATLLFVVSSLAGCTQLQGIDITDAVFTERSADCADYVGSFSSQVRDEQQGRDFSGSVEIRAGDDVCSVASNSIPNHDFAGAGAQFATAAAEVQATVSLPRNPQLASSGTAVSLRTDNAVMLNGVKLDLLAAACYGVGDQPLGEEKIGCMEANTPWRYDPMYSGNNFGTDGHNAHTQPDGAYHHHGSPEALFDTSGSSESGLIGFAADGFPIYGPFIEDEDSVRAVESSYQLKAGERVSQSGEGAFPGGSYDGTYRDDYEYLAGSGDLDECNGMTRNGSYGYYVTDGFPWVLGCFVGSTDPSFDKSSGGAGPG